MGGREWGGGGGGGGGVSKAGAEIVCGLGSMGSGFIGFGVSKPCSRKQMRCDLLQAQSHPETHKRRWVEGFRV